jgi:hypothetical protein
MQRTEKFRSPACSRLIAKPACWLQLVYPPKARHSRPHCHAATRPAAPIALGVRLFQGHACRPSPPWPPPGQARRQRRAVGPHNTSTSASLLSPFLSCRRPGRYALRQARKQHELTVSGVAQRDPQCRIAPSKLRSMTLRACVPERLSAAHLFSGLLRSHRLEPHQMYHTHSLSAISIVPRCPCSCARLPSPVRLKLSLPAYNR